METLRVEMREGRSDGVRKGKKGHLGATDVSPLALLPPCNPIFTFSLFPVLSFSFFPLFLFPFLLLVFSQL